MLDACTVHAHYENLQGTLSNMSTFVVCDKLTDSDDLIDDLIDWRLLHLFVQCRLPFCE